MIRIMILVSLILPNTADIDESQWLYLCFWEQVFHQFMRMSAWPDALISVCVSKLLLLPVLVYVRFQFAPDADFWSWSLSIWVPPRCRWSLQNNSVVPTPAVSDAS